MDFAYWPCTAAGGSSSVDDAEDVGDAGRHHSPAMGVSAMFAGTAASAAGWAR